MKKRDLVTIGRFATGGLLTGAGGAALLSLARMISEMRHEQKDVTKKPETDESTIVLTLPRKQAEVKSDRPIVPTVLPAVTRTTATGYGSQPRRPAGTFGPATKYATAWPALTAGLVAGTAGTAIGAHLVNRLYQKHREKRLAKTLEEARQEYLDKIQGNKTAEALADILTAEPMEKEALLLGGLNWAAATAAFMTILGAAGAGYVTKRILDERYRETATKKLDLPKVNRIVFRSSPVSQAAPVGVDTEEEGISEKAASAEDIMLIKSAVCVMCDVLDSEPRILNTAYVKEACAEAGVRKSDFFKAAQDIDALMQMLKSNPKLQTMITRAGMEKHPLLKHFRWATNIPGIKQLMNRGAMNKMTALLQPGKSTGKTVANRPPAPIATPVLGKAAGISLLSSFVGSTLADRADDEARQTAMANAIIAAQEARKLEDNAKSKTGAPVEIVSDDDEAQEYIATNYKQIVKLVRDLKQAGKL